MKIAIQAADLDAERIDGTRVYILNLLKYFGKLDQSSEFLIYHKNKFNPHLTPPILPNYKIIKKSLPHLWTQTVFAGYLWKDRPDVLWMPMHNIPIIKRRNIKTIVTIHDLAFKYFPETFTRKDLLKINFLTWNINKLSDNTLRTNSTKNNISYILTKCIYLCMKTQIIYNFNEMILKNNKTSDIIDNHIIINLLNDTITESIQCLANSLLVPKHTVKFIPNDISDIFLYIKN